MADFTITAGDTLPVLQATLYDGDAAMSLATASSVVFRAKSLAAGTSTDTACTITNAAGGVVECTLSLAAGSYDGKWIVTFSGGGRRTVPTGDPKRIVVQPE